MEDWLYDDGFNAPLKAYKSKIKELEEMFSPIQRRVEEHLQRPEAIKARIRAVALVAAATILTLTIIYTVRWLRQASLADRWLALQVWVQFQYSNALKWLERKGWVLAVTRFFESFVVFSILFRIIVMVFQLIFLIIGWIYATLCWILSGQAYIWLKRTVSRLRRYIWPSTGGAVRERGNRWSAVGRGRRLGEAPPPLFQRMPYSDS